MKSGTRIAILVAIAAVVVLAAVLLPPIPQPLSYHAFADQQDLVGVPNFADVVSNSAFLLVGLYGLAQMLSLRTLEAHLREPRPEQRPEQLRSKAGK